MVKQEDGPAKIGTTLNLNGLNKMTDTCKTIPHTHAENKISTNSRDFAVIYV